MNNIEMNHSFSSLNKCTSHPGLPIIRMCALEIAIIPCYYVKILGIIYTKKKKTLSFMFLKHILNVCAQN